LIEAGGCRCTKRKAEYADLLNGMTPCMMNPDFALKISASVRMMSIEVI
jgi:hypothetical protein